MISIRRKRAMAKELLEKTGSTASPELEGVIDDHQEMVKEFSKVQFDVLVDLYVKHFTEEQLECQLAYFTSEMGKSILKAQQLIYTDYPTIMEEIGKKLNAKYQERHSDTIGSFSLMSSSDLEGSDGGESEGET